MLAVLKRELKAYLLSPIGYVFMLSLIHIYLGAVGHIRLKGQGLVPLGGQRIGQRLSGGLILTEV